MSTENSNAQAVIDAARQGAEPKQITADGRLWSIADGESSRVIDVEDYLNDYRDQPRRKTGTFTAHTPEAFIDYLARHTTEHTEVWADTINHQIVGVINAHGVDLPGYADHKVAYRVQPTDAWKAWAAYDGKLLSQTDFAEHIEARSIDIVKPTGADMLELAETFQANIGVNFESSQALSTGERQFQFRETVDAKAGRKGQLTIPKQLTLALIPFEGADPFKVTARFRYRITDGVLRLGYVLERPADVVREAFESVVAVVQAGVEDTVPVFRGVTA